MRLELVASFPGHSRLQFSITCSMHKRRGKAWEIRVTYVTSGRQCPIVVTHKLCDYQPRSMNCIDAVFQTLPPQVLGRDITGRTSRLCRAMPPSRLPSCLHGVPDIMHSQAFPLWPFLHTASDQNWRQEWSRNEAIELVHIHVHIVEAGLSLSLYLMANGMRLLHSLWMTDVTFNSV